MDNVTWDQSIVAAPVRPYWCFGLVLSMTSQALSILRPQIVLSRILGGGIHIVNSTCPAEHPSSTVEVVDLGQACCVAFGLLPRSFGLALLLLVRSSTPSGERFLPPPPATLNPEVQQRPSLGRGRHPHFGVLLLLAVCSRRLFDRPSTSGILKPRPFSKTKLRTWASPPFRSSTPSGGSLLTSLVGIEMSDGGRGHRSRRPARFILRVRPAIALDDELEGVQVGVLEGEEAIVVVAQHVAAQLYATRLVQAKEMQGDDRGYAGLRSAAWGMLHSYDIADKVCKAVGGLSAVLDYVGQRADGARSREREDLDYGDRTLALLDPAAATCGVSIRGLSAAFRLTGLSFVPPPPSSEFYSFWGTIPPATLNPRISARQSEGRGRHPHFGVLLLLAETSPPFDRPSSSLLTSLVGIEMSMGAGGIVDGDQRASS
ncbi:hypothetical protein DFP72DRAFT_857331 [Ephemerocybe angulata]|uniref:Uncharacterized protein n=1 Tax=Ephemerocybe angulata TaxID=980116 RepID=A0A8H6LVT9_9AGAR|nr:hypothetical protein DFP72DRAFT_857331 [Tulosesus angulatus]